MRKSDRILAAAAIISVAIYSVACRLAWDSSGERVAFPFEATLATESGDKTISGVAVYYTATGEVKRLYEEEGDDFSQGGHVVWTEEGDRIIATAPKGDKALRVIEINATSGKAETIAILPGVGVSVLGPILIDKTLYVGLPRSGDNKWSLGAVDIDSWEVKEEFGSTDSSLSVYGVGESGLVYVRAALGKAKFAVGTIDDGDMEDVFTLPEGDYPDPGPWLAVEGNGTRLATVLRVDEKPTVRVLDEDGTVVKDIGISGTQVDNCACMTWIGDTIWIGAVRKNREEKKKQLGIVKVTVESGDAIFIPLGDAFPLNEHADEEYWIQPSLSPDGRTVAVSGFFLSSEKVEGPIALVLLDAAAPEKEPRYIPLPLKEGEAVWRGDLTASTDSVLAPEGEESE